MKDKISQIIKNATGYEAGITIPERDVFGHYSTALALKVAKDKKQHPQNTARELAEKISQAAPDGFFEKVDIVAPGFINFWLSAKFMEKEIGAIVRRKKITVPKAAVREKIQVEFISANPTGPLTLANGRGGFFGDVLSNVLKSVGHEVEREFYVNDDGNQILTLGKSVLAAAGVASGDEKYYKGEYVLDWAKKNASKIKKFESRPIELGYAAAADFLKLIRRVIEKKSGIRFDRFTSERLDIRRKNLPEKVFGIFKKKDLVYEKDGAIWFKSTLFGDDKDRVLITSDGFQTYYLVDAGHYLETKKRGFRRKINILGPDHHGYVNRIQAAARVLELPSSEVLVTQAIRLISGGREVKMSKRKGQFVTFEELVDEVGLDAARFFFLSVSLDSHMDFDLDLARQRSVKNPVYYVQYAHARAKSILKKIKSAKSAAVEKNTTAATPDDAKLMRSILDFPDVVAETASDYGLHRLTHYCYELARAFHNFYEKEQVLKNEKTVDGRRLKLVKASQIALSKALGLLGITAPDKM